MRYKVKTAPTEYPVTLNELKLHLGLDSGTFDGNLTLTQSLPFASHVIAANFTTHVGTGVAVLGKEVDVIMHNGTNGAGGTVETKIQESDQLATGYTDWTGGLFATVTTSNDNTDYKLPYTGIKKYIRTVSRVLVASCDFGTSILVNDAGVPEDTWLTEMIIAATRDTENDSNRKLITQTIEYYPQCWPNEDRIKIPFGNLQSVSSITYKDIADTVTTMVENTDYLVEDMDTNGDECGYIVLPYGYSWPNAQLHPSNPITITFICGYGLATSIPATVKQAIKRKCSNYYENRGEDIITQYSSSKIEDSTYKRLINSIPPLYDNDYL